MGFLDLLPEADSDTWSVSELTAYIRELFEMDFRLQDVAVSGEVSNYTHARSGHLYFTLKDSQAQLKCVMWRNAVARQQYLPQDGDAVVVHGRISVYDAGGVYQLYADRIIPAGRGNLAVAFEQLKQRLAAEGLFDAAHKKSLPVFPRKIGIVTSPDAAALRDILNVLRRRYPLVSVLIAPTLVQGDEAPPQIVRALQWLDGRDDVDTIIVARGGGSMEDLWAFNDERVARAIFAARHPVISGVGHETDFTIADFVADVRAPTPSAAAELAVPDVGELRPLLVARQSQLVTSIQEIVARKQDTLHNLQRALGHLNPANRLNNYRQYLDNLVVRLEKAIHSQLTQAHSRLALAAKTLHAVSPQATLARGYAIVRDENGRIVRTIHAVQPGDKLQIQVQDGRIPTIVTHNGGNTDVHPN
ncbi:MAG: exodeoxyribonuclease VII large subunit [Chloroflexi bacterium]|nr:MAG: exodeoxyribonuclease VII large subunit [Chloroflexota bacterium]